MARLFAGRKESSKERDGNVSNNNTKRFSLFRRGRSETPLVPPEAKRVTPERKTQSYRISVYEVRSESPTPTCSSTEDSDSGNVDMREGILVRRGRSQSPSKRRSASPFKERRRSLGPTRRFRSKSPTKIVRTESSVVPRRQAPQRTSSEPVAQEQPMGFSPRRGILKRATFSMVDKSVPAKPQAIASFDLELARATSLTDNMSTDAEDNASNTHDYPLRNRDDSFVIQPKRTVSFSQDVVDSKPKPTVASTLCLGTRTGRRVPRRRGDFSLFHEFEDLCDDLTYFCRCLVDESDTKKTSSRYYPTIPEDDLTHDSSTLDRSIGSI